MIFSSPLLRTSRRICIALCYPRRYNISTSQLAASTNPHKKCTSSLAPFLCSKRLASSQASIGSRLFYPVQRILHFFKNDPFAKVSVIFGGVVLGILLIIEAFTKTSKKLQPQIVVLPPQCSHSTVTRSSEVAKLIAHLPTLTSRHPAIVCITGPSGSGKTVLVTQLAQHFLQSKFKVPFRSSAKPIVLTLDGSSQVSLDYSLRYAAFSLGISSKEFYPSQAGQLDDVDQSTLEEQLVHFFSALFVKLTSQKCKWLLVVDNLQGEAAGVVDTAVSSVATDRGLKNGCVVVSGQQCDQLLPSLQHKAVVSLQNGLTEKESMSLFLSLMDSSPDLDAQTRESFLKLSQQLNHMPLLVSLAGLTIRLYAHFLASEPSPVSNTTEKALSNFCDVLGGKLGSQPSLEELAKTTASLYIEALCASDPYFMHALDFLSSSELHFPMPLSTVAQHLKHPFFNLSPIPQSYSPLADPPQPISQPPVSPPTYFEMIKSKLPFVPHHSAPLPAADGGQGKTLQKLADAQSGRWSLPDLLTSLCKSPFIHTYSRAGLELLSIHSSVVNAIEGHFLGYTVPKLEESHLRAAREQFKKGGWLKQFRNFSEEHALASYLKSLPGLSEGGVLTEEKFKALNGSPIISTASVGLSYSQYLHTVSHHHRVSDTLTTEMKYLSRDAEDLLLCRYLQPHLSTLVHFPWLPTNDQLRCRCSLTSIDAAFSPNSETIYNRYSSIVEAEKDSIGSTSTEVANTLTRMAEIKYYRGEYAAAEDLLQSALLIHKQVPDQKRSPEQSIDLAVTMSTLGLVYLTLGRKQQSKDCLETALGLYQTIPAVGEVSRKQRKLVATTVTDLGHAYISLGDVLMAKRYLELALTAHRNIHSGGHPEVARALNVSSVVYALMGDSAESKRLRKEAQTAKGAMVSDVL